MFEYAQIACVQVKFKKLFNLVFLILQRDFVESRRLRESEPRQNGKRVQGQGGKMVKGEIGERVAQ